MAGWKIIEIETAGPGWRAYSRKNDDGSPVAIWALVEDGEGHRFVVGLDPTAQDPNGWAGGRLLDIDALMDSLSANEGGYIYRAPLS